MESLKETPQLSAKTKAKKEDVLEEIWHPHVYFISVKKNLEQDEEKRQKEKMGADITMRDSFILFLANMRKD